MLLLQQTFINVYFLCFQLQAEVQRLEVLKKQSMKSVIAAIRAEIVLFWQKCFYSPEQQQAFVAYHSGGWLLLKHKQPGAEQLRRTLVFMRSILSFHR